MRKLPLLLAAVAIVGIAGNLRSEEATPTPTPVPVVVAPIPANTILKLDKIPLDKVESIRQAIVQSGAFAFPESLSNRPIVQISLTVSGSTARATIIVGPPTQ